MARKVSERTTPPRSKATAAARERAGPPINRQRFAELFEQVVSNVELVIKGKADVIRLALVALFSEGHMLFEDVPGVGKSMLARALGKSIGAEAGRVQCTPDMLPGDIIGSSILNQTDYTFTFRQGPVFANIVLVDEINRATPKTQSALLEAMAERSVTVDGITYLLPRPFLVMATQNPIELAGTFPLPEAQLDRFLFKLSVGYPNEEAEEQMLNSHRRTLPIDDLQAVLPKEQVLQMIEWASGVTVSKEIDRYIISLVQATRQEASFQLGASPRASLALMWSSRVLAASQGKEDVYPDDVKALVPAVMAHRVILTPDAALRGDTVEAVLERVVGRVKAPLVSGT